MNLEVKKARAAQPSSLSPQQDESRSAAPAVLAAAPERILPVDPGFSIESHMYMRQVKGEDIAFSYRAHASLLGRPMPTTQAGSPEEWKLNFDVFVLCDGHSGSQANIFVRREFLRLIEPQMPRALPSSFSNTAGTLYAGTVRAAVTNTLETLNEKFCEIYDASGCTCTVAVYSGALLTVANIGDSDAVLDTFSDIITMTVPHRINDNDAEKARLMATGAEIAPLSQEMDGPAAVGTLGLGPLRIWPGGLCVSRSIGDKDVGPNIIATPHVRQVLVPEWGCRLIIASDGVWDCISKSMVVSTCKGKACGAAATNIVNKCVRVRQGALADDTTCVVIDCKPHNIASFKGYVPDLSKREGSMSVKGATGPVLAAETSMDAVADGAPNQMTAPVKPSGAPLAGAASLGQHRSDSDAPVYIPPPSLGAPPQTPPAPEDPEEQPPAAKLSTIVSHVVSDDGESEEETGAYGSALSTVGKGTAPKNSSGTARQEVVGQAPAQPVYGAAVAEERVPKRRSGPGLLACCFSAPRTADAQEQLRVSMLNDHTHHAGSMQATGLPVGACKPGGGLRRADTSLASIGAASSDTVASAAPNSRADPSGHNSAAYSAPSEGSRGGGGLRSIASVAGSLNFLRRKKAAVPLVTFFADVDMLSSPASDESSTAAGAVATGGSVSGAPAGSLILRSTSTADGLGTNGAHSPGTPPSSAAPQTETPLGGGSAPEGRQRGGRPRHNWTAASASASAAPPQGDAHPRERGAGTPPQPPAVFAAQSSEMSAAGSAWGSPVQVSHSHAHATTRHSPSPAPAQRHNGARAALAAAPGNRLDSPSASGLGGKLGKVVRCSAAPGAHHASSPEVDMGALPASSALTHGQTASNRQGSSGGMHLSAWGVPAEQPATGNTVGTDGEM